MKKPKHLSLIALAAVLAVAILAGCSGGSSASLQGEDVAVVGDTHITKAQFASLMAQAKRSYTQQGKRFPKQGTSDYETLKNQAVAVLVQQAERSQKASDEAFRGTDSKAGNGSKRIRSQNSAAAKARNKRNRRSRN